MVEENFDIWLSGTLQNSLNLLLFHSYTFTIVEENFEIWLSEMPQNSLILLFYFRVIPPPWLKKILRFNNPKRFREVLFTVLFHSHTFTMVKENFEIWFSETLQNSLILLYWFIVIPSPWLKIFWNLSFWNASEQNNFTVLFIAIPSSWLKKMFKFDFLKRPRIALKFYSIVYLRHG